MSDSYLGDVFADTHYFLSLLLRDSQDHRKAVDATMRRRGRLITTSWVMIEVANFLSANQTRAAFGQLLQLLQDDESVTILPPDEQSFEDGVQLYKSRPDKNWSLTDCLSFQVMQRLELKDAFTADHHFVQAGFNALLA